MNAKTIFIIAISVLLTVILMNNTDMVDFWIFGNARVPKLAVMAVMFFTGAIVGFILGRPRKKAALLQTDEYEENDYNEPTPQKRNSLSDEDREYIS
jgi:hypothetical protein